MIALSIVIVNYNVKAYLLECLRSIYESDLSNIQLSVYVVDNASIDESMQAIKKQYPQVHCIESPVNLGFSKANNLALRQIHTKYTLILNPDTLLASDTLQVCVQHMEDHADVGAIGAKMLDSTGRFLPESKRGRPTILNSICKLSGLDRIFPESKWIGGYNLTHLPEDQEAEIDVLCGAFMFVRTDLIHEAGYFDERFFMYGEDIDLSVRIQDLGVKIKYLPTAKIIHFKGESTKIGSLDYVKTFYGAMALYVGKHYQGLQGKFFQAFLKMGILVSALLSFGRSNLASILKIGFDFALLYKVIGVLKEFWAVWYFGDIDYYDQANFEFNRWLYVPLWIFGMWFFGHYDKPYRLKSSLAGIAASTLSILVIYALLPLDLRSSRALILIGAVSALVLGIASEYLLDQLKKINQKKNLPKKTGIVRAKTKLEAIPSLEVDQQMNLIPLTPEQITPDFFRKGEIDEMILDGSTLSYREMMPILLSPRVQHRIQILTDHQGSLIGTNASKKDQRFKNIQQKYKLSRPLYLRVKRLTDLCINIVLLLVLPIGIWKKSYRSLMHQGWFSTLLNTSTWIGYHAEPAPHGLPALKPGILPFEPTQEDAKNKKTNGDLNNHYAKHYDPWMDLYIIYHHLK